MIILSAGGYGYIISESTAPPEMETYDFGEFTMEIPEDSNVKLAGSDLSLSVYVGDNFQVIIIIFFHILFKCSHTKRANNN